MSQSQLASDKGKDKDKEKKINECRFCLKKESTSTSGSSKLSSMIKGVCSCTKLANSHLGCLTLFSITTGVDHCGLCGSQFKGLDGALLKMDKEGNEGTSGGGVGRFMTSLEEYYTSVASLLDRILIGLLLWIYFGHINPGASGSLLSYYLIGHVLFFLLQKVIFTSGGGLRSLFLLRLANASSGEDNVTAKTVKNDGNESKKNK